MNSVYECYASAAFGMEGLVASELKKLGVMGVAAENGGVRFSADGTQLFLCNLSLRFSERIYLILASGICKSFEQLFQLVSCVNWTSLIKGPESIDVSCKCTRSALMSPRDCQSITKKAIIESVRRNSNQSVFPETGPSLSVHVTIRSDNVFILLNTSGDALSRRGYRTWNGEAPLRETLASALVELSGWVPGQPIHDPCCGTGTILVEAALVAAEIAPGLNRSFSMEKSKLFQNVDFDSLRSEMNRKIHTESVKGISGSDIDPEPIKLAKRHIQQAGLEVSAIPLRCIPLQDLLLDEENGVFLCNPPYGERLSDQKHCRLLYHELFSLKKRHPTWRLCAISSDPAFERSFGKRADRKRRLYNGRLECGFYVYK